MNTATAAAATHAASRHASRRWRSVCSRSAIEGFLPQAPATSLGDPADRLDDLLLRTIGCHQRGLIRLPSRLSFAIRPLSNSTSTRRTSSSRNFRDRLFNHRAGPLDPRPQLPFRLNQNCPKRLDRGPLPPNVHGMRTQRVEPLVAQRFIHVAKPLAKLREAVRAGFHRRHGNQSRTRESLASIRLIHVLTTN